MGSRNRFKNRLSKTKDSNLSRAELIKKYGLSSFREDDAEQAALNASKPSPDFSKDPKYASTGGPNGNKFIGDKNTTGGTGAKETTPRRQNFKMRLGYPLARGPGEKTGDTLLIKCIEYMAPEGGVGGLGLSYKEEKSLVTEAGKYRGKSYKAGETVTTGYSDVSMNVTDANSRMSRNQNIKYYVELPIPQEVSDSNTVSWGEDKMNIFQLAGITAASQFQKDAGQSFQQALDFMQKGISFKGFDEGTQNAIRNAISGAAINQLGGNVSMSSIISRTTGQVLNSNLELLFGGVNLRSFPFSITFTPRYYEEMMEVKQIIRQLKSSMNAKGKTMSAGSASGAFLKSPDVFSLRYLHNGQDHPFLNQFKMCALTGMSVNYTNAGTYASYGDGSPVSIRLNMTFKELNPIYSEDYDGMGESDGVGF
tara:strand:- start:733 stop:2001 length:1269 start_codon:yes stop_codon:yes gene_type:complete